jgi:hypothetical protein
MRARTGARIVDTCRLPHASAPMSRLACTSRQRSHTSSSCTGKGTPRSSESIFAPRSAMHVPHGLADSDRVEPGACARVAPEAVPVSACRKGRLLQQVVRIGVGTHAAPQNHPDAGRALHRGLLEGSPTGLGTRQRNHGESPQIPDPPADSVPLTSHDHHDRHLRARCLERPTSPRHCHASGGRCPAPHWPRSDRRRS